MRSRAALVSLSVMACVFAGLSWHAATRGDGWMSGVCSAGFVLVVLLVVTLEAGSDG